MVLVDPKRRQLGIATKLMHGRNGVLTKAEIKTIKPDATPAGRSVYEICGLQGGVADRALGRDWQRGVVALQLSCAARGEALVLDRRAFGVRRSKLIEM
jgi:hypothetical protein